MSMLLTRLKEHRERNALTQLDLARSAGLGKMTVYKLEAGVNKARPATTRKLAAALKVKPSDLMASPSEQLSQHAR